MTSIQWVNCYSELWMSFAQEAKQGRIHGIRCYETPLSAVKEKALRTDGRTDGRMDIRTNGPTDGQTLL